MRLPHHPKRCAPDIIIHADDTRGLCTHKWLRDEFLAAWRIEFNEEADASETLDNFTGLSHVRVGNRTEVTCRKITENLASVLSAYPFPPGMSYACPIGTDSPRRLDEPASEKNPLMGPKYLDDGRRMLGTGAFITYQTYPTGSYTFGTLARYMSEERLTKYVWLEVLRFAYHLVSVGDIPLVFTKIGEGARIEAWADSSMASPGAGGRAPGGFIVRLGHPDGRGSAPLITAAQLPRKVMTATGSAELEQAARATKAVIGIRIFFRELHQSQFVTGPTPVFTDAQAVIDGTHCRRVSREAKWTCINYALMRQAEEDGAVIATKCATEDNVADILTKPLVGPHFVRAQRLIQGLPPA